MKVEHHQCPYCDQDNHVKVPENFDDRVESFLENAPSATLKSLSALAAGTFFGLIPGVLVGSAFIVESIYNDGTAKCANPKCGERFRIR
jgi:hypothetical protein